MSQRSDIDRLLRHWMDDGPTRMPDRIVDVVADRISVQRQLRSWRLLRRLSMNPFFKLTAAAAAVLVIAVVGYNLLPRQPSVGGPGPTPSPTATPAPTLAGIVDIPEQDTLLEPGRYRFRLFDDPTLSVVADVPDGWSGMGNLGIRVQGRGADAPTGLGIAFLKTDRGLYSDPCHWDLAGTGAWEQDGDVEVGPEVSDLVDALRANTSYTSTEPSPVAFGEFEGQELEIQVPGDLDLDTCDVDVVEGGHYYRFMPDTIYVQGDGNRWRMSIVDVAGTRVIVTVLYYSETPAADLQAAQAIVESLEFTP
jgi:hypothetical protein